MNIAETIAQKILADIERKALAQGHVTAADITSSKQAVNREHAETTAEPPAPETDVN